MNRANRLSGVHASANMFFDKNGILHVIGNNRHNKPSVWRHTYDNGIGGLPPGWVIIDSTSSKHRHTSEIAHYDNNTYIAQSGTLIQLELNQNSLTSSTYTNLGEWAQYNANPTDMAISPDGMIYLTANDEFQVYDIKNDTWSTSDYPDDASSGYAQIAFDNDGTLFFIGTSPAGGLRSWEKPLDSDWSQGLLIDGAFNSNSLLWSINSQLLLDSSGFRHLLYMNDGTLHYLKENVTGWQNEFNTTKPSQTNNG